jgi:hypothetical protein
MEDSLDHKYLFDELHSLMLSYGYNQDKEDRYIMPQSFGWDSFEFEIKDDGDDHFLLFLFRRRFEAVEAALVPFYSALRTQPQVPHATLTVGRFTLDPKMHERMAHRATGYQFEQTPAGINEMLKEFDKGNQQTIFSFLRAVDSLQGLDRIINDPPSLYEKISPAVSRQSLMLRKYIIAKLANNPNLPAVRTAVEMIFQLKEKEYPKEIALYREILEKILEKR